MDVKQFSKVSRNMRKWSRLIELVAWAIGEVNKQKEG